MRIEKIKKAIKEITGMEDDEIKTLFPTEQAVRDFYKDLTKVKTVGTDFDENEDDFDLSETEKEEIDAYKRLAKDRAEHIKSLKRYEESGAKESGLTLEEFNEAPKSLNDILKEDS